MARSRTPTVAAIGTVLALLVLGSLAVRLAGAAPHAQRAVLAAVILSLCACAGCGLVAWRSLRRRQSRLEAEVAELEGHARVESATMLRNQRAFQEDLELELLRADRTGRPASLIVLSTGAEPWEPRAADVQRHVLAQAMTAAVRRVDVAYRIGADEFALILAETRASGALVAAERVMDTLGATGALHCTAGVAEAGPGIDRRMLFRHAYVALLAAGREGRPSVLAYAAELERGVGEPAPTDGIASADAGR